MTNHFCVIVLFEYICDMDHESHAKIKLIMIEMQRSMVHV